MISNAKSQMFEHLDMWIVLDFWIILTKWSWKIIESGMKTKHRVTHSQSGKLDQELVVD